MHLSLLTLSFCSFSHANVIGSDFQNFNTVTSGLDFVTVQSSQTLTPGIINFGAYLNLAVNTLPYFDNNDGSRTRYKNSLLGSDLNLGVGLMDRWDVGVSLPAVLSQSVDSTSGQRLEFGSTGLTETRFNTKYRVWGDSSGGIAFVGTVAIPITQDNPYTGDSKNPIFNLEGVIDQTFGDYRLGFNAGYRFRNPGATLPNSGIEPVQDQFILSAAASRYFTDIDSKIIAEVFSSFPVKSSSKTTGINQSRLAQSAEILLGIKHDFTENLAFHFGAGTALIYGSGSPDYRVYTGLNYALGPLWDSKKPAPTPAAPMEPLDQSGPIEIAEAPLPPASQYFEYVAPLEEEAGQKIQRIRTASIKFKSGSTVMIGDYEAALDELADKIKQDSNFKNLIVEGHTDSVGKFKYNEVLSKKRADTIRTYLISKKKVPATQVIAIGYGPSRPISDNANYQGRQLNRRVEFQIVDR